MLVITALEGLQEIVVIKSQPSPRGFGNLQTQDTLFSSIKASGFFNIPQHTYLTFTNRTCKRTNNKVATLLMPK